jgi:hypothetical protein
MPLKQQPVSHVLRCPAYAATNPGSRFRNTRSSIGMIVADKPFCVTSRLVYAEATIGFSAIASLAAIATIWTSESASLRHSESASLWTGESTSFWHSESAGLWTGESASLWPSTLLDVRNIASVALSPRRATIARGSA